MRVRLRTAMLIASVSATAAFAPGRLGALAARGLPHSAGRFAGRQRGLGAAMNLSPDSRNRQPKRPQVSAARSMSRDRRDPLMSSSQAAAETSKSYFEELWDPLLEKNVAKREDDASCSRKQNFCELDPFFFADAHELPLPEGQPTAAKPSMRTPEAMGASEMLPQHWIDFAHRLADASGDVLLRHYRSPALRNANKADGSPVTVADKEAEDVMRALIEAEYPETDIFGEETGHSTSANSDGPRYTWVLDPIDGTKSFLVGKPTFGTLISLVCDGVPVLGIINQPVTRERWVGAKGCATTLNGDVVRADDATLDLGDAVLFCTDTDMLKGPGELDAFKRLKDRTRFCMYSCDCYGYGLLASGHGSLVVEADLKPYDFCALVPIIQGAGGFVSDWEGRPLTMGSGGQIVAAGNEALGQRALDVIRAR